MIEKEEEYLFETPEWLEKRHEWNKALEIYSEHLIQEPSNPYFQRGKLRCLKNLFDWENLSNLVGQMWDQEVKALEKHGKTTCRAIVASLAFEPIVFVSRNISWMTKSNLRPDAFSLEIISSNCFR